MQSVRLVAVGTIARLVHVSSADEPQGDRIDAVANATAISWALREHVAEMAIPMAGVHLGASHAGRGSVHSTTFAFSIGFVKLGQPHPDSYLSVDATSGSPATMSR